MSKVSKDIEQLAAADGRLSRRAFLAGIGAVGSLAAAGGLAACAPSNSGADAGSGSEASTATAAGDWLGVAPEIGADKIAETRDTDALIIGAGNGGLVAGATAAQEGLDFILAEKNTSYVEDRHWIGAVNSRYTKEAGITVDPERVLFELSRYASNKGDQSVMKVWIKESAALIDWLDSVMGAKFELDTAMGLEGPYYIPVIQHMYGGLGGLRPQEGWLGRNGTLEKIITDAGKAILYEHRLVKLLRSDGGKVAGGIFERADGSYIQINAKNTVLATGGYADNPKMIEALIPIVPKCCTANSFNPGNDGSGLRAALHIGAQKDVEGTAMIFDRGAVPPGMAAGYDGGSAFPGPIMQFNFGSQPFLKVDQEGRRFANESTPYDFITHAAAGRKNGTYVQVFDSRAAEDVMRFQTVGCSKVGPMMLLGAGGDPQKAFATEIELGALVYADTLQELAQKLELPTDRFTATVQRYNELYDKQADEDFGKESYRLSAVREAPFYGVTLGGSLLTTIDGLRINEDMQVLDTDGAVIDGLYAVGDVSGCMFSGNYPELLIGVACGRTLTFGRHVALHLAGKSAI